MATPAPAHLLVRSIANAVPSSAGAAAGDSAGLESAALIVRSATKAVLEGETVGVPRPPRPVLIAAPIPPPPTPAVAAPRQSDFFGFALGDMRMGSDGIGNSAPRGFGVHLGVGWRRLAVGVMGITTLDRDAGTFDPQPYWVRKAAVFLDVDIFRRGPTRVTIEALGGRSYFHLYNSAGNEEEMHKLFGAELRGAFDVVRWARLRVPIWLGVGVDYIPGAPTIKMIPTDTILWVSRKVQPRVMIGTGLFF
ncbi:MAG: hypothetical protein H7X95_12240 [Deltaproteobacteria bacterium]|nr:hypothetical protein [Deltaproteobacteria bacterium]